jgi:hypothetical protein
MAELKTQPTSQDPQEFLASIADESRRADARAVFDLMALATGEPGVMWGTSIIGFGQQHLRYDSGRELDWMVIGFSPRKSSTTIYLSDGCDVHAEVLARLGRHTTTGSCLYVKRLADVDQAVLAELVTRSVDNVRATGAPGL